MTAARVGVLARADDSCRVLRRVPFRVRARAGISRHAVSAVGLERLRRSRTGRRPPTERSPRSWPTRARPADPRRGRSGQPVGATPVPIVIPCHRVIGADGSLTGYRGGFRSSGRYSRSRPRGGLLDALTAGWPSPARVALSRPAAVSCPRSRLGCWTRPRRPSANAAASAEARQESTNGALTPAWPIATPPTAEPARDSADQSRRDPGEGLVLAAGTTARPTSVY